MHTNEVSYFRVGDTYTNDQIRFSLHLENLGGIRPALGPDGKLRHVAIMTATEDSGKVRAENPYRDKIEGDILVYTAQGRAGDQDLNGRNRRLIEQYSAPTPFFGFANVGRQTYRFLGLLELLRHYQENQADSKGKIRRVWVFEFRVHRNPEIVPIGEAGAISARLISQSRETTPIVSAEREVAALPLPPARQSAEAVETVRANLIQYEPRDFEQFIRVILEKQGFVNVAVTRMSGDGGIDLNAFVNENDDFFSGTHLQVQVKRWRHAVGSPEINSFRGALNTTAKGVFITTSHFTRAATVEARHASKPSIALIDGDRLANLVIRLGAD
jgi:HJR/Mrr/RecB family endonuclease